MKERYEILAAKQARILTALKSLTEQAEKVMEELNAELGVETPLVIKKNKALKESSNSTPTQAETAQPTVEVMDLEKTKIPYEYYSQEVTDTRWGNEILVALGLDEIKGVKSIVIHRAFTVNNGFDRVFCDMGSKERKPYYICSLYDNNGKLMQGWWQTKRGFDKNGNSRGVETGRKFKISVLESHVELMGILAEHHYDAIDKERDWMPCCISFAILLFIRVTSLWGNPVFS